MHRPAWVIFLAFLCSLAAAMLLAALLSPAVQALLAPLHVFPLHRIFNRLVAFGVLVITGWLLIHYRLANRTLLGYSGPWPRFLKRALVGVAAGLALMTVALVPLFALDLREWNAELPQTAGAVLVLFRGGLAAGLAVALIEETFFRGAMQGALTRRGAVRMAVFAVPAFYSAVHFFGKAIRIPFAHVDAGSGFEILASYFHLFLQPLAIWDAFLALYLVGLLLALVRHYSGDIAGCIGLHAGFVAVLDVMRNVSTRGRNPEWSFVVGSFDGLLGLWISLMTALSCLLVWRIYRGPDTA